MEQEKREQLIEKINKEYQEAEKYITDSITAWAGAMRRALIETVKFVYMEKLGEDSWNGQKLFDALNNNDFKQYFPEKTTTTISDMHKIRELRNSIEYNDEDISMAWRERYLNRLKECIEDVEKVLGISIIKLIQKEVLPPSRPVSTPVVEKKPREKVKHSRFGEGEIVSIKGDIIKVVFGVTIKEFPYPSSMNNGTLIPIQNPIAQPAISVPKARPFTSLQKHRWTFDEDKTCCRIFIETYITNHTYCPLDSLATKILTIYPNMKFSSIKMKLQNIKRICLDYGIKDSSTISPLDNYSNQNFQAMKEELLAVGIII